MSSMPTSRSNPDRDPNPTADDTSAEALVCDFCGEAARSVRRIALDGDYERLRTRHQVQYACERCSEDKERSRTGQLR